MPKNNPQIQAEQDNPSVEQELVKATFYLTPAHVIALEELKLKLRKQGEKADKSELVRRAIDLLIEHSK